MRRSIERGMHIPGANAEDMFADLKERLIDDQEPVLHRRLADGRIVAVRHQPMADGGCRIGAYEDITERHRAEQNIAHMARHDASTDLPGSVVFPSAEYVQTVLRASIRCVNALGGYVLRP